MRKLTFLTILFCSYLTLAQKGEIPYFVPQESYTQDVDGAYILAKNDSLIRMFRFSSKKKLEIIEYRKDDPILCNYLLISYTAYKNRIQLGTTVEKRFEVLAKDTLIFARKAEDGIAFEKMTKETKQFLGQYTFKDGTFYHKKWQAVIGFRPAHKLDRGAMFQLPWFKSPFDGKALVKGKCSDPEDLDCVCAALTHGADTEKEISDAIATFIIERFSYRDAGGSQKDVQALVFGNKRETICVGYSMIYEDLMKRAKVPVKYVTGAVRSHIYDVFYSGHSHAWNEAIIDDTTYILDVTWANSLSSHWYLRSPEEMFISHFKDDRPDTSWSIQHGKTMYDFMNQPYITEIYKNGLDKLSAISVTSPIQFAEGTFKLTFNDYLQVGNIEMQELSYPFVRFQGDITEVATQEVAQASHKQPDTQLTQSVELELTDKFNNISIYVYGLGRLHYIVFNGSERDFYRFFVDHIQSQSAYSVAMAFMACAKMNDPEIFKRSKPYLTDQKTTFKSFMKSAKNAQIEDFSYAFFDAISHFGTFEGYSLAFSKGETPYRIYLEKGEGFGYRFHSFKKR
jgi:hypothetical protein